MTRVQPGEPALMVSTVRPGLTGRIFVIEGAIPAVFGHVLAVNSGGRNKVDPLPAQSAGEKVPLSSKRHLVSKEPGQMATHRIASSPRTVRWGTFDASYPPLLTLN